MLASCYSRVFLSCDLSCPVASCVMFLEAVVIFLVLVCVFSGCWGRWCVVWCVVLWASLWVSYFARLVVPGVCLLCCVFGFLSLVLVVLWDVGLVLFWDFVFFGCCLSFLIILLLIWCAAGIAVM